MAVSASGNNLQAQLDVQVRQSWTKKNDINTIESSNMPDIYQKSS